jgi:hypothetical protein
VFEVAKVIASSKTCTPQLTFVDSNMIRIVYPATETFRITRVTSFNLGALPLKESIEPS